MKKALFLLIAITLGMGVKAQCPLSTAVDFTATDIHGTEVHLFDILDNGQYVLIDFFYTTCGYCIQSIPHMVQSYSNFGCNMHDVFFMEVDLGDSQAACLNWANNYGVEYPTIAGANGGNAIVNQYHIEAFPTVILIAPDHSIVIQDLYPIPNAQAVATALENQGLTQQSCEPQDIMPDFTATDIEGNEIHLYDILDGGQAVVINFFLSDDNGSLFVPFVTESYTLFGCNDHDVFFMEICPDKGDAVCQNWVETYNIPYPTISREGGGNSIAQSIPVGFYPTVMIIRPDHSIAYRDLYPLQSTQTIVNALESEGYGQSSCQEETLTFSTDTVYVEAMELVWVTVFNNTTEDAIVTDTRDQWGLRFTLDGIEMFWGEKEYTIPHGNSIELGIFLDCIAKEIVIDTVTLSSNLPDASFVAVVNFPEAVDENEASVTLFPSPANDFVTLKGENLGTVRIYNALGQKMDEFDANGTELRINTTRYENGVYFIKTSKTTLRFLITH